MLFHIESPEPVQVEAQADQLATAAAAYVESYLGADKDAWAPFPTPEIKKFMSLPGFNPPRLTGDVITVIKALLERCVRSAAWKQARAVCNGCIEDHPSQVQHTCIYFTRYEDSTRLNYDSEIYASVFRPPLVLALHHVVWRVSNIMHPYDKLIGAAEAFMDELCQDPDNIKQIDSFTDSHIDSLNKAAHTMPKKEF